MSQNPSSPAVSSINSVYAGCDEQRGTRMIETTSSTEPLQFTPSSGQAKFTTTQDFAPHTSEISKTSFPPLKSCLRKPTETFPDCSGWQQPDPKECVLHVIANVDLQDVADRDSSVDTAASRPSDGGIGEDSLISEGRSLRRLRIEEDLSVLMELEEVRTAIKAQSSISLADQYLAASEERRRRRASRRKILKEAQEILGGGL